MSKELFKAILNKEFYLNNKDLITEDLFKDDYVVKQLFEVIKHSYEIENTNSLSLKELMLAFRAKYPAETETRKQLAIRFLTDLDADAPIQESVATYCLKQARIRVLNHAAAQELLVKQGIPNVERVKELLSESERLTHGETSTDIVDLSIDNLLLRTSKNSQWKFNIPALSDMCGGIGISTFTVIAGRVNSGKSLAGISFCFGKDGFAEQGAKILYLCNEEDGGFPGLRAVSAYTGMTFEEINNNKVEATKVFSKIRDKVIILDNSNMHMSGLTKMVIKHKPDVVVIDMLDHIKVAGEFAREDLRLGQVYRQAREIAKNYKCAVIGISQLSADADGKLIVGFDTLAGSKTDKAAAADLILLLGQNSADDQGNYSMQRAINVAKNKITGRHGAVHAVIVPELSRLIP